MPPTARARLYTNIYLINRVLSNRPVWRRALTIWRYIHQAIVTNDNYGSLGLMLGEELLEHSCKYNFRAHDARHPSLRIGEVARYRCRPDESGTRSGHPTPGIEFRAGHEVTGHRAPGSSGQVL